MKRLFFALEVPDFEKCAITLWREKTLPTLTSSVITDNLHLTLCFLGNTDIEIEQNLIAKLNHIHAQKIDLSFTKIGYFKKPKVLYIQPNKVPEHLLYLVQQLNEIALSEGGVLNYLDYKPHITVARKTSDHSHIILSPDIKIQFTDIVLYHSQCTKNGLRYRKLRNWPLN
ncbi:RNA 2',3'-cyclic phosphodiesterase [Pseudoalteromonas sp. NBT06-2]|uniref:RNA 2',3'-cyclic phosphodiesterase n=1 Tax=Pseudoalteromonas sp. NBT06-2 TaxID=2025950 RepID=UPI000BA7244F|nr:RNA 2',3'-cyclic phosphodiesterase [Pseudoalteromonas sp. NBT06-2]PAJ74436.1 RNA 2',3'-cyclic phosphodiesterase [Pseudoalteromonas sp. NBT06-2]